ncbi:MAG: hypothetical protein CSB55_06765 [Candidatus Cloacimonadota bacterium]|nr:MAG: hypothetical protein CSB55_06765 [Candidatus Cloacimonadota bacterium]
MTFYGKPIKELEQLPSVPIVLNKILTAIDDNSVSNKEVAQIIGFDPILTAKVLSLANSALFGGRAQINEISAAVTRLGRSEIKNIAMTIYIANMISGLSLNSIKIDQFWKHSLATGFISRKLVSYLDSADKTSSYELENNLYIAGLLHDLGFVFWDMYMPLNFKKILETSIAENETIAFTEKKIQNTNYVEEGAKILRYWSLPTNIVSYIINYSNPEKAVQKYKTGAYILNAGTYISNLTGFKNVSNAEMIRHPENIMDIFTFKDYSEEDIKDLFDEFLGQSKLFIAFSEMIMSS